MATFKVVTKKAVDYNKVYIRISQKSISEYIGTEFKVHKSGINKKKEVTDAFILSQCALRIRDYMLRLNSINSSNLTANEIKKTSYCRKRRYFFFKICAKIY